MIPNLNFNELPPDLESEGYLLDIKTHEDSEKVHFYLYFASPTARFFVKEQFYPSLLLQSHNIEILAEILMRKFPSIHSTKIVYKTDPASSNYINKPASKYLRVAFENTSDFKIVCSEIQTIIRKKVLYNEKNVVKIHTYDANHSDIVQVDSIQTKPEACREKLHSFTDLRETQKYMIQNNRDEILTEKDIFNVFSDESQTTTTSLASIIDGIYEYDLMYEVQYMCERNIRCGKNYRIKRNDAGITMQNLNSSLSPNLNILAYDIEVTKDPLKFPAPTKDKVVMISMMGTNIAKLLVNQELVGKNVCNFSYYVDNLKTESSFDVEMYEDEKFTLARFMNICQNARIDILTTYNGVSFDLPFLLQRIEINNLNENLTTFMHLDCYLWVKRDSYLPIGSQGLKSACKAKLGYDPEEIDPEEMMWYCQHDPQRMAVYAVSDAYATFMLYSKYVHPFIFSLCSLIPLNPENVLSKGSGTLCESLLISEAISSNILIPNIKQSDEYFFKGRICEEVNCVGGHVESLRSGIYRDDFDVEFFLNTQTLDFISKNINSIIELSHGLAVAQEIELSANVIRELDDYSKKMQEANKIIGSASECNLEDNLRFIENSEPLTSHQDYFHEAASIREHNRSKDDKFFEPFSKQPTPLMSITDKPKIYHMDVSAMYPNIILTNRLQPISVIQSDRCIKCDYYSQKQVCQRKMSWMMRVQYFLPKKSEILAIKRKIRQERFQFAELKRLGCNSTYNNSKNKYKPHQYGEVSNSSNQSNKNNFSNALKDKTTPNTHLHRSKYKNFPSSDSKRFSSEIYMNKKKFKPEMQNADVSFDPQSGTFASKNEQKQSSNSEGILFSSLSKSDQKKILHKRIQQYSREAYKKIHSTEVVEMENIVCQRDEPFYVDVVRNFRDKRYEYKEKHKIISKVIEFLDGLGKKQYKNTEEGLQTVKSRSSADQMFHKISQESNRNGFNPGSHLSEPHFLQTKTSKNSFGLNADNSKNKGSDLSLKAKNDALDSNFHMVIGDKILKYIEDGKDFTVLKNFVEISYDISTDHIIPDLSSILDRLKKQKVIYESLQVAHKCILNSFYGYVMRKAARWYSMEMGAIVCHTGSQIIKKAKDFIETIGIALELDTDGIWCMIPKNFPNNYKTKDGKNFSLILSTLNFIINREFVNEQYLEKVVPTENDKQKKLADFQPSLNMCEGSLITKNKNEILQNDISHETTDIFLTSNINNENLYEQKSLNTILFELDGPYKAMIIPASVEEGRLIKKKYVVINTNNKICELKGFETKRRGELSVIKRFQEELFQLYTHGTTLRECYDVIKKHCTYWLALIENKGRFLSNNDIFALFSESKNMSKPYGEYLGRKTTATCTALRLSEILGPEILMESGLKCQYIISRYPPNLPTSDRAVPVDVFCVAEEKKKLLLKKWLKCDVLDLKTLMDWNYYKERLESVIVKLVILPSILQGMGNCIPEIKIPEWAKMHKKQKLQSFMKPALSIPSITIRNSEEKAVSMDLEDSCKLLRSTVRTGVDMIHPDKNLQTQLHGNSEQCENLDIKIENIESNVHTQGYVEKTKYDMFCASKPDITKIKSMSFSELYIHNKKDSWIRHFRSLRGHFVCRSTQTSLTEIFKGQLHKGKSKNKVSIYIKSSQCFDITNITIIDQKIQCAAHNKGQEFIKSFLQGKTNEMQSCNSRNDNISSVENLTHVISSTEISDSKSYIQEELNQQTFGNSFSMRPFEQRESISNRGYNNSCTFDSNLVTPSGDYSQNHHKTLVCDDVICMGCKISDLFLALNIEYNLEMSCSLEKMRTKGDSLKFLILSVNESRFNDNFTDFVEKLEKSGISIDRKSSKNVESDQGLPDYIQPISIVTSFLSNELVFFLCKGEKIIILCEKDSKRHKNIVVQGLASFLNDNVVNSTVFFVYKTANNLQSIKDVLDKRGHFLCVINDPKDHFFFAKKKDLDQIVSILRSLIDRIRHISNIVQVTHCPLYEASNISYSQILDTLMQKSFLNNNILDLDCMSSEYSGTFSHFRPGYYEKYCFMIYLPHTLIISIVESKTLLIEEQPNFLESTEFRFFQNFCKRILLKASSTDPDADLYNCLLNNFNHWCLISRVLPCEFRKSLNILHKRFLSYFYYKVKATGINVIFCNSDVMCIDTSKSNKADALNFLNYLQEQIKHISGLEMLELKVVRIFKKFAFYNLHNYFFIDQYGNMGAVSETKIKRTFLQKYLYNDLDRIYFYDLILKRKFKDIESIKMVLNLVKLVRNIDDIVKTCSTVLKYDFDQESHDKVAFIDVFCKQCSSIYTFSKNGQRFNKCLVCLEEPSITIISEIDVLYDKNRRKFIKCAKCNGESVRKMIKDCFCGGSHKVQF